MRTYHNVIELAHLHHNEFNEMFPQCRSYDGTNTLLNKIIDVQDVLYLFAIMDEGNRWILCNYLVQYQTRVKF